MNKKDKLIVECDFDGVIYSVNDNVMEELSKKFGEELVKEVRKERAKIYTYKCYPEEMFEFILSKLKNPDFMTNEDFLFPNAIEFLKWINKQERFDVVIRTLVSNEELLVKREEFFDYLFKKYELDNIKYLVVLKKDEIPCDILIEDNPEAILRKKDGIVIVRRHPYNAEIKETERIIFADDLQGIKEILQDFI